MLMATLWLAGCGGPPQTPLPRELVVTRAQPSVLQVVSAYTFTLSAPAAVSLRLNEDQEPLLKTEFEVARASGAVEVAVPFAAFCWGRVASEPDRWIEASEARRTLVVEDLPCATGTAFSIDDRGTLMTNAHVIAPLDASALHNPNLIAACIDNDVAAIVQALAEELGQGPDEAATASLSEQFVPWLCERYSFLGNRLAEARLTTRLRPGWLSTQRPGILPRAVEAEWKADTIPCEVIACGEVYPGKDVALLRAPSLASKLISLPLGDSDHVMSGTAVHAMGFPAAAVIPGVDSEAARFRVIAHDGILDQRLPTTAGWEAFHMTANINHGDSGGPVIDGNGDVVAINVAGNNDAAAQTLAVPIGIGKELMASVDVVASRNPATEQWYDGFRYFAAAHYESALDAFTIVDRYQRGGILLPHNRGSQATAMMEQCTRSIEECRDTTPWTATAMRWWPPLRTTFLDMSLWSKIGLCGLLLGALGAMLRGLGWLVAKITGR